MGIMKAWEAMKESHKAQNLQAMKLIASYKNGAYGNLILEFGGSTIGKEVAEKLATQGYQVEIRYKGDGSIMNSVSWRSDEEGNKGCVTYVGEPKSEESIFAVSFEEFSKGVYYTKAPIWEQTTEIIKDIERATLLGWKSKYVCCGDEIHPNVVKGLLNEGYDVEIVRRCPGRWSYNRVSWANAREGRKGNLIYVNETT